MCARRYVGARAVWERLSPQACRLEAPQVATPAELTRFRQIFSGLKSHLFRYHVVETRNILIRNVSEKR